MLPFDLVITAQVSSAAMHFSAVNFIAFYSGCLLHWELHVHRKQRREKECLFLWHRAENNTHYSCTSRDRMLPLERVTS